MIGPNGLLMNRGGRTPVMPWHGEHMTELIGKFNRAFLAGRARRKVHADIEFDAGVELARIRREFESLRRSVSQQFRRAREEREVQHRKDAGLIVFRRWTPPTRGKA